MARTSDRSPLLLLAFSLAHLSAAQTELELSSIQLGPGDTLLVQQYSAGCFGDGGNWARVTREGASLTVRYWSRDTTWVLHRPDDAPLVAVRNFCTRIADKDQGCTSTTTDWYLVSFIFHRLTLANGRWHLGEAVNVDDVKNSATFIRMSCGGNDYPWYQFKRELSGRSVLIGSKADRRERKRLGKR